MNNQKKIYQSLECNNSEINNTQHVWYTHYRGYIVKSTIDRNTNKIIEEKMPYNQPNNYINFIDNYFKYKLN